MATATGNFNIPPPANFNPKTEDWNQWISRYELFEAATRRDELPDKVLINTLIYIMGNNPADIFQSFKLSSEGNTYTNVKQKFKEHFKGKVALVFERTQLVRRLQQEKEGVMSFIEDLQKRADICSFGDLRDQMVHSQIVPGLCDSQLRRRLMANDNSTLDQVIAEAKSAEITKQHDQILQSNPTAADLSEIKDINDKRVLNHRRGRHKFRKGKNVKDDDRSKHNVQKLCYKCGAQPSHPPNHCPAKDVTCSACKKKGHFAKVCRSSKRVQSVDDGSSEDDVSVMTIGETVNMVKNNSKWKTNALIGNHNVKFKIDTGADVTVIPEDIFRRCKFKKALRGRSKRSLHYGRNSRKVDAWKNLRDRRYFEEIEWLSEIAKSQPHTAYIAFTKGSKFTYFMCTIESFEDYVDPIQEVIDDLLLPTLFINQFLPNKVC